MTKIFLHPSILIALSLIKICVDCVFKTETKKSFNHWSDFKISK